MNTYDAPLPPSFILPSSSQGASVDQRTVTRREFLNLGLAASAAAISGCGSPSRPAAVRSQPTSSPPGLMGQRFLTLSIPIRVFTWEVSRDVIPLKQDEYEIHTPEAVRSLREAFRSGCPDGRLTWSFTLNALEDQRPHYREIRDYVARCQKEYGDEVTYFPSYFAAQYLPRERINREMSQALALISRMVGGGYRPQSVIVGFLPSACMKYLAEREGIHVAHGVIWSQLGIDGGDGDGSPSYPFYPSSEHFCKAAQGSADFVDCVNLDGWTMDFITARQVGSNGHGRDHFNSRRGVAPIETIGGLGLDAGIDYILGSQSCHFDHGFDLNGFAWVTSIWEAALVGLYAGPRYERNLITRGLARWLEATRARWPQTRCLPFGEFGEIWRRHFRDNDHWDYRFEAKGLGVADSKAELAVNWYMNKTFRLGLIRNWQKDEPWKVMDFTRYDLPAIEPADPVPAEPIRNWSLMNRLNQKGLRPQDKPLLLSELTSEERRLIGHHYPMLVKEPGSDKPS
jgi:hypothetical protein